MRHCGHGCSSGDRNHRDRLLLSVSILRLPLELAVDETRGGGLVRRGGQELVLALQRLPSWRSVPFLRFRESLRLGFVSCCSPREFSAQVDLEGISIDMRYRYGDCEVYVS
jgi:hypothetical protein